MKINFTIYLQFKIFIFEKLKCRSLWLDDLLPHSLCLTDIILISFYIKINQQHQISLQTPSSRFLCSSLSLVYSLYQVTLHVSFVSAVALQKYINSANKSHEFKIEFLINDAMKNSVKHNGEGTLRWTRVNTWSVFQGKPPSEEHLMKICASVLQSKCVLKYISVKTDFKALALWVMWSSDCGSLCVPVNTHLSAL